MVMRAPIKGGDQFPPLDTGTYIARVCRLVDLGTQESEIFGDRHQLFVAFELPFERRKWTDRESGEEREGPAMASAWYTFSGHQKSNLRIAYENVIGSLDDRELEAAGGFDPRPLLGMPCQVVIGRPTTSKKEKVTAVTGIPAGLTCPSAELPAVYLELTSDGYDPAAYEALTPGIRAIVARSPEWQHCSGEMARKMPVPEIPDAPGFDDPPPHTDSDNMEPF